MLKSVNVTQNEANPGKEKTAKNGIMDLVKNNKQKLSMRKNSKQLAFSRLLQEKQNNSLKKTKSDPDSLKAILALLRKNLDKNAGIPDEEGLKIAANKSADQKNIDQKAIDLKTIEQLKKFLKNLTLADAQNMEQLNALLEKLRNKDKLNKNDLSGLLSQLEKLISPYGQQVKKAGTEHQEKKGTELSKIPENKSSRKEVNESRNEPRIVIIDLRKPEPGAKSKNAVNKAKEQQLKMKSLDIKEAEAELISKEVKLFTSPVNGSRETGNNEAGKSFQNTLQRTFQSLSAGDLQKLNEVLKNEIVKNTGIILKTNNQGEIRLVLKPETLGKVRINLNLENNRIDGKILVENSIVREIIENSLQGLNNALMDEGFDAVSLQVSINDGHKNSKQEAEAGMSKKEGADEFEKNLTLLTDYSPDYSYVNLVI